MMRNLLASDDYDGFNRLYLMEDPWEMSSEREQTRFRVTNELIAKYVGRVGSILEIGSGEGHQSLHLSRMCDRLVGIDVAERAVSRARTRVPTATFIVSDVMHLPADIGHFDLVVACEMLYAAKDIPATLASMNRLGDACLVSFFESKAHVVAPHLASLPVTERRWEFGSPYAWLFAFWRSIAETRHHRTR